MGEPKRDERRIFDRFEVTWDVDCTTEDTFLYASISNISEMGIFVTTREPLVVGTKILLSFTPQKNQGKNQDSGATLEMSAVSTDTSTEPFKLEGVLDKMKCPYLIIHGDADKRVPLQQSESFVKKATEAGATAKLIVKPGAAHGWPNQGPDVAVLADWFDQYLRGIKK